jgi:hypothetical protein
MNMYVIHFAKIHILLVLDSPQELESDSFPCLTSSIRVGFPGFGHERNSFFQI